MAGLGKYDCLFLLAQETEKTNKKRTNTLCIQPPRWLVLPSLSKTGSDYLTVLTALEASSIEVATPQ